MEVFETLQDLLEEIFDMLILQYDAWLWSLSYDCSHIERSILKDQKDGLLHVEDIIELDDVSMLSLLQKLDLS